MLVMQRFQARADFFYVALDSHQGVPPRFLILDSQGAKVLFFQFVQPNCRSLPRVHVAPRDALTAVMKMSF
jgi:hypothetical protein